MIILKIIRSSRFLNISKLNNFKRNVSTTTVRFNQKTKICVVGSGPAGFYASQYLLKNLTNCNIDMIEKLPVPYGLVRYGVAPDHPEVKNVINTFSKIAENKSFQFYGNLCLGKDVTLKELRNNYHVVLLTYGAEKDRELNIPNESKTTNISAREFVAWYNGLPGYENLKPNLQKANSVSIIGQGNVAIDVARILLSPIDKLKTTDITDYAFDALTESQVEKVYLIGRRGPLQAAFTIKELREMLKLPGLVTKWRKEDFIHCTDGVVTSLQRPRKRLTELMLKSLSEEDKLQKAKKEFLPIFMRTPKSIKDNSMELIVNKIIENKAIPTNDTEIIETNLILRSIGYKSIQADNDINFDENSGYVRNINGRVLKNENKNSIENDIDYGLYVTGWLGTGPIGVILTTMNTAFVVAKNICDDITQNRLPNQNSNKLGLNKIIENKRIVTWDGWKKIDEHEIELGKKNGKPREKIVNIEKMLKIAGV